MDQILQRGRSAPVTHNRSFSVTLNQTHNNPLVRKEEASLSPGLQVTSARLVGPQHVKFDSLPQCNFSVFISMIKYDLNIELKIISIFHAICFLSTLDRIV